MPHNKNKNHKFLIPGNSLSNVYSRQRIIYSISGDCIS